MGWKPITNNVLDIKKKVGEAHLGTYTGRKDITTKIGPQVIWQFTDEDEQPFGVYGFTNLNRAMESLAIGQAARITYQGTASVKTKFGIKDVHQVSVEVFEEDEKNAA